jgi:DNA-binding NarL/FixJ family response regulator
VLLADDQAPARAGIKRSLEPHGFRVVAEASNASDAHRMAVASRPEVCLLAVELPGGGIEAARLVKHSVPSTKIVMMAASPSDEDLFGSLRAGADGYLPMSTSAARLPYAIRDVADGEAALPRALTARARHQASAEPARRPRRGRADRTRVRGSRAIADARAHLGDRGPPRYLRSDGPTPRVLGAAKAGDAQSPRCGRGVRAGRAAVTRGRLTRLDSTQSR